MSLSLQVIYPATDGSRFDFDYYLGTHMAMVGDALGGLMESALVARGLGGGTAGGPPYHAIATMVFPDKAALDAAMDRAEPLLADIPNFFSGTPEMMVGEVVI